MMLKNMILGIVIVFCFLNQQVLATDLALDWKPEPEFGGFYEALFHQDYQKQGLDIKILPGGAGQPVTQMVAAKKVTFGIASAPEVILARNLGAKVVALFAVYQNNPQGFMVHPERKIKSLKELFQSDGVIALQKGLPFTAWLEKQYSPFKAKIVPYTGGVTSYIQNKSFSQQCFVTSEPVSAKREKQDSQTFLISESGWNPYVTVVIAHEDTLKNDAKMVEGFLNATQKGWMSYLKSSKETNAQMQKLNPTLDLLAFDEASRLQVSFVESDETRKHGLGFMSQERWKKLYSQMVELKLVNDKMSPNEFFIFK